jgi:hypothetical protein
MTIPITSAIDLPRSDHCEQSYLYPEYDILPTNSESELSAQDGPVASNFPMARTRYRGIALQTSEA